MIVGPATGFRSITDAEITQRCAIGPKPIRHDLVRPAVVFQRFLQEFKRDFHIMPLRHEAFERLARVVDGAPGLMPLAVDIHENIADVLLPLALPHP